MMRAFHAVEAGPLSPGDYPAIRSSSAAVRALVDDFVTRLDLIVDHGVDAVLKSMTLLQRADMVLPELTISARAPVGEFERLETYPQNIGGMKPRSRAVQVDGAASAYNFSPPHKWGEVTLPRKRAPFPCLVPGCTNVGAPIYGMVCVEHKGTPKRKIARLRAERAANRR